MAFVDVRNLSRKLGGRYVLKDISLSFPSKGLYAIKGENGCGKSTLLEILDLLDLDYEGSVTIEGRETRDFKKSEVDNLHRFLISYVSQRDGFVPFFTAEENVKLTLSMGKCRKKGSGMSSGEMMLSVLERNLKPGKSLYLLDEITANLDIKNTDIVLGKIKELSKDALVILVTHDETIAKNADGIVTLKNGLSQYFDKPMSPKESKQMFAKPSQGLLFKGALKSSWLNMLFSTIIFFLFSILVEAIIAFPTYDFKRELDSLLQTDDIVLISESVKEANDVLEGKKYQYDGCLTYDEDISDDKKIHVSSSTYSSLYSSNGNSLPSVIDNSFFSFSSFEFVIDESVPFEECFANPNIKSLIGSDRLVGDVDVCDLSICVGDNSLTLDRARFFTLDSMRRSIANLPDKAFDALLDSLDEEFALADDEVLVTDSKLQGSVIELGNSSSSEGLCPDLESFYPYGAKSLEWDYSDDSEIIIVSDNVMDALLQSTSEQWISKLFLKVDNGNRNALIDFIYEWNLFTTLCVKRKDTLVLSESIRGASINSLVASNLYRRFDFGRMRQISSVTSNYYVWVCIPAFIFLISLVFMSFSNVFSKNRKAIRTCHSLGYSKASIFFTYVLPYILLFAVSYLVSYPLSIIAWGYDSFNAGFSFMPGIQWPMILIMIMLMGAIASLALISFIKVFKKK